ncbi:hypothetical protein AALC75_18070 [Lachnospiraceae bacterium 48-42]
MTLSKKQLEQILSKELQIPDKVNERINDTYDKLWADAVNHPKGRRRRHSYAAAAIAVICCLAIPGGVYAAANSDFFDGMFGNTTKKSTLAVTKEFDNHKGGTTTITLPSHEYVSVDPAEAEKLLGSGAMSRPVKKQLGEHTLCVENLVYDQNSALMYFTLEREGGVTLLVGNEETNAAKGGAYFDENDSWYFGLETTEGNSYTGNIYTDTEKSTKDKVYYYAYMAYMAAGQPLKEGEFPILKIFKYSAPLGELPADYDMDEETVPLTEEPPIPIQKLDLGENGYVEYSPISISPDLSKGTGLTAEQAGDPWNLKHLEIKFKDGSSYVICDTKGNIENNSYSLTTDTMTTLTFNRLVNTEQIKEIILNDKVLPVE